MPRMTFNFRPTLLLPLNSEITGKYHGNKLCDAEVKPRASYTLDERLPMEPPPGLEKEVFEPHHFCKIATN